MSGDVAKKISFEPRASSNQIALNDKFRVLDLDAKRTDLRKTRLRSSKALSFPLNSLMVLLVKQKWINYYKL